MRILTCCLLLLPVAAQPAGKVDWKPFSPKDGAFTTLFPAPPEEHTKPINTPQGMLDLVYYEAEMPGRDGKLLVGFTEFAASSIKAGSEDKRLDHARDGAVASTKGKLLREKSLLLDNYPGRELEIEIEGKARVVLRLYAVKNRLYQVVVAGSPEFVASPDALKFLTSFKIAK
jgi:hypothetical protein